MEKEPLFQLVNRITGFLIRKVARYELQSMNRVLDVTCKPCKPWVGII